MLRFAEVTAMSVALIVAFAVHAAPPIQLVEPPHVLEIRLNKGSLRLQTSVVKERNGKSLNWISDEQFAQAIFGGASVEQVRSELNAKLDRVLQEYDRRYSLNSAQMRKLRLAGRGDINDWFDRVEQVRIDATSKGLEDDHFETVRRNLRSLGNDLNGSLFDGPSLLCKVMARILAAEQAAQRRGTPYQ